MTTPAFSLRNFSLLENSDRRILAALRCSDAITGAPIRRGIRIEADGAQFIRNLKGDRILTHAPGFEAYQNSFYLQDLPAPPPPQQIQLSIFDSSGRYLPRRYALTLPRNPDTDAASLAAPDSLFSPADIPLYPSGLMPISPGWATLRATILNSATGQRLPWALIRVEVNGSQTLSQADYRGEALIAVPGLPITTWSTNNGSPDNPAPVTTREFEATFTIFFDPTVNPLNVDTDFLSMNDPNDGYLPDPDDLNSDRPGLLTGQLTRPLASGTEISRTLSFSLTP